MLRNRMVIIGGIALALLAAGCDNANTGEGDPRIPTVNGVGGPTTTSSSAATTEPSPTPSSNPSPEQPAPPPPAKDKPAGDPNECKVADLTLSLGGGDAAAGTRYRELRFTNSGQRTCVIQGFPGVSFVAGEDGHQVGQPAYRDGTKGPAITLRPGQTAFAPVGFAQIANYDPAVCRPTEVRGLRVYPPHEYDSMFLAAPGTGCAGDLPGHQLLVRTVQ